VPVKEVVFKVVLTTEVVPGPNSQIKFAGRRNGVFEDCAKVLADAIWSGLRCSHLIVQQQEAKP